MPTAFAFIQSFKGSLKRKAWAAKLPDRSTTFSKLAVQLQPVEPSPLETAQDLAPGFCVSKAANTENIPHQF